ncbi:hypothetical protein [Actinoplanes sp. NPDC048796]|uniref:hypothetical protein n=1 Tax=Actinoplanes sp. NPDC048796 TaxID=3155640 RepID=UPI0033D08184
MARMRGGAVARAGAWMGPAMGSVAQRVSVALWAVQPGLGSGVAPAAGVRVRLGSPMCGRAM